MNIIYIMLKIKNVTDVFQIIANIVVIIGVIVGVITLIHTDRINSGQLMVEFNNELRNSPQTAYPKLIAAVSDDEPLLVGKNPHFTSDDIDSYLVMWETLDNLYQHKLISEDMVYDTFSYDIEAAYCNLEIRSYIKQQRAENPEAFLYVGFEELALRMMKLDSGNPECIKI